MIPHSIPATHISAGDMPVVQLSGQAQEETYAIARILMDVDISILKIFGLQNDQSIFMILYTLLVFAVSLVTGWVMQMLVVFVVRRIGDRLTQSIYGNLRSHNFFSKTAAILPPIVFLILIQFTLGHKATLLLWLSRFTYIWLTCLVARSLCILSDCIWERIDERSNKKKLPLKGILQLVKGIIWILCAIVSVAVLCDKSPAALLTGLGAFAAVLMLIFKDSILGLVAGVQLSENDSLHVGDWIAVNGTNANGTVMEVSLTAVKILNWDKTITTVPPYNLISGSFTNYRNMQQSNTRRIQRSYMVDADSVVPTDEKLLLEFSDIPLLKDWITKKIEQRNAGKECDVNNPDGLVDGSIESNLGVFRAYLKLWLDANPNIAKSGDLVYTFVTTLPQTAYGIPLQVYCFTSTSAWLQYEAIMASVFEHIAVMMYKFHLYTYESASGRDTIMDGWLSPGKNPDVLFGMPYPFFNDSGTPDNPGYPVQQSITTARSVMAPDPKNSQQASVGTSA